MSPNLSTTLSFLAELTRFRLAEHFGQAAQAPQVPTMQDDDAPLTRFIQQRRPTVDEYVALAASLAPHVLPTFSTTWWRSFCRRAAT